MGVYGGPNSVTSGLVLELDAANRKSYSSNYHPAPLDIYSWVGPAGGYQQTLSRDTIQSPVGNTPLKIVTSGTSSYSGSYNSLAYNIASAASGQTWTVSFYVKASVSTTISMLIFESNSSGGYLSYTQPYFNIGTDWTRVSGTATFSQATTASIQTRIDCYVSGVTLWVDGYQVERSSSMSTFTSVYTGDICNNLTGSSNTGTLTNGVSYNDSNSGSFIFNGTNNYIIIPENSALNTQTPTVEVWVKTNATTQSGFWFEKGQVNTQYSLFQEGAVIQWRQNFSGSVTNLSTTTATYMNTTSWYQIVGTYTSGSRKLYINGTLVNSDAQTGTIATNANGMSIGVFGGYNGARGYYYSGNIASVKIYNRELSAAEISQNFNATRGRYGV
jgi:hypothetical protein